MIPFSESEHINDRMEGAEVADDAGGARGPAGSGSFKRRIALIVTILAVLGVLAYGLWPDAIRIETERVRIAPLAVTFEAEGVTRFRNRHLISAPAAGWMDGIVVEPGDTVAIGVVLARIRSLEGGLLDERSLRIGIAQMEAAAGARNQAGEALEAARQEEAFAGREWERQSALAAAGIGSERALDAAGIGLARARSQRKAAEDAMEVASKELEAARERVEGASGRMADGASASGGGAVTHSLELRAPADGIVLSVKDRRARPVMTGERLLELGHPASLEVVTEVLSRDAVRLRPGMQADMLRWGGDADLAGEVVRVEPMAETVISALGVEEQRVNVVSRLRVDASGEAAPDGLGDGYRVVTRFTLWRGDSVLQAPSNALFRYGEGWAVFRVRAGRVGIAPVETGREAGLWTEIRSGLDAGDMVVRQPDERLAEGRRVKVSD